MYAEYLTIEALTAATAGILLVALMKMFSARKRIVAVVFFPLAAFSLGFYLRLTGIKEAIDIGFFFTDFSFLFVYILFALAFLLGQMKYWKRA
jgi:hypothetical protein